jgi:hypothetical protein
MIKPSRHLSELLHPPTKSNAQEPEAQVSPVTQYINKSNSQNSEELSLWFDLNETKDVI